MTGPGAGEVLGLFTSEELENLRTTAFVLGPDNHHEQFRVTEGRALTDTISLAVSVPARVGWRLQGLLSITVADLLLIRRAILFAQDAQGQVEALTAERDRLVEELRRLREDVGEGVLGLIGQATRPEAQENRWLPGEKGKTGVYADDNCEGAVLRCFEDAQGDVWLSMHGGRTPLLTVRMVAHCSRRPHVLRAARRLAQTLVQPEPLTGDTPERLAGEGRS